MSLGSAVHVDNTDMWCESLQADVPLGEDVPDEERRKKRGNGGKQGEQERSQPLTGVQCIIVAPAWTIHPAGRPGAPMEAAVESCREAPKNNGVKTVLPKVISNPFGSLECCKTYCPYG